MDKFGIFNLLNSFFNFYNGTNSENTTQTGTENSGLNNLFSALKSSPERKEQPNNSPTNAPPTPLQSGMLKTMNSHDQILKRVKENSKKTKQP